MIESVRLPGSNWEDRFNQIREKPGVSTFFQQEQIGTPDDGLDVHSRNNLWIIEAARRLVATPDDLYALLVWDEKPTGDGPGGTSDFVQRVKELGGHVAPPVNPTKIN